MAKIHVCDICGKEREIFFKCRIKHHTLHFDYGEAFDETMFFCSEICEACLKKLIEMQTGKEADNGERQNS